MIVSSCPGCRSDDLALYSEPDGSGYGVWITFWWECESCGRRLEARLVEGQYLPVSDEETP